jgi:hypothetical protein
MGKKCWWRLLLIFVALIVRLATCFAQDTGTKTSSYAPVDSKENIDTITSRMKAAKPNVEKKHMDLLNELLQPDSSNQTERTVKEEPCGIYACILVKPL